MYTDTITLFNRYKSDAGDMWYPTVIHGVNLNMDKAAIVAKYGSESKDKAMLGIHYATVNEQMYVDGKLYLPPQKWSELPENEAANAITFKTGKDSDFFLAGSYESTNPILDIDYEDGFYNFLHSTRDYVFAVSAIGGPYKAIPHFEIMGA